MICQLFILVFNQAGMHVFLGNPAAPKNFDNALSGLLPFSWMMVKCSHRVRFCRRGHLEKWHHCCVRFTAIRAHKHSFVPHPERFLSPGHHDARALDTFFHHRLSSLYVWLCFFQMMFFLFQIPHYPIYCISGSCFFCLFV